MPLIFYVLHIYTYKNLTQKLIYSALLIISNLFISLSYQSINQKSIMKKDQVATLNAKNVAPELSEKKVKKAEKAVEEKTKDLIREKAKESKPEAEKEKKETRSRIFRNVDYNASPRKQKTQRQKVRDGLFKIITPYLAQKRAGSLKNEKANETFESFKSYVTQEYTVPLDRTEELFKGGADGIAALNTFLPDFKAYLAKAKK
jgi:hypothetical protein